MEGSYMMSPSPTSPTNGYHPCWTDVSYLALDSVTLIIILCGVAGNGAVLRLLCFHIRRNPITVSILCLTITDFTFLLFSVFFNLHYMVYDVSCYTLVPPKDLYLLALLPQFSYNMGLYLLTAISIESCVSILCPLWFRCHRPQRRSRVICFILFCVLSFIATATDTLLCDLYYHRLCYPSVISIYTITLVLFAAPMVISSTVLFIKVKCGSQQQQLRRLHVVVFLTVVFFLSLDLPLILDSILDLLHYPIMSTPVVFLLACINSSIKPLIYFLVGSCRRGCSLVSLRVSLQRVFEEPEEDAACSNDTALDTAVPGS